MHNVHMEVNFICIKHIFNHNFQTGSVVTIKRFGLYNAIATSPFFS